jgi:excisionase family DNA binding protein
MTERLIAQGLLSPQQLADYIDVPVATVYRWNYERTGPRAIKVGRHVRYRIGDVESWLESRAQGSEGAA